MTLLKATLASSFAFSQIAVGLPVLGKEVFHRLKVGETRRSFRVHVPRGYNGTDALPMVLYRVRDGGHTWPGGPGIPFIWPVSKKISATDAMCEFFWKHPKIRSSAESVTGDKL